MIPALLLALIFLFTAWVASNVALLARSCPAPVKAGRSARAQARPTPFSRRRRALFDTRLEAMTRGATPQPRARPTQVEEAHDPQPPPAPTAAVVQGALSWSFGYRDLRGVNLRGRNLVGANLATCNLVRANLAGRSLRGANLAYADLTNANLVGADLSDCDCTGAIFHGANLQDANMGYANLSNTRFGPTTRYWAEIYNGGSIQHSQRKMVDVLGANVRGLNLDNAILTGSDIQRGQVVPGIYWTEWMLPTYLLPARSKAFPVVSKDAWDHHSASN